MKQTLFIQTDGPCRTGLAGKDGDLLLVALIGQLKAAGHKVISASFEAGGIVTPIEGSAALHPKGAGLVPGAGELSLADVMQGQEEMKGMFKELLQAITAEEAPVTLEDVEVTSEGMEPPADMGMLVLIEETHDGVREVLRKLDEMAKPAPKGRSHKKVETVDVQSGKKEAGAGAEEKKPGDEGGQEGTGSEGGATGDAEADGSAHGTSD